MSGHGRPPSINPSYKREGFRFTADDIDKLQYCVRITQKNKTEIIRMGINRIYDEIKTTIRLESEEPMGKILEKRIEKLEAEVKTIKEMVDEIYNLPFIIAEIAEENMKNEK